MGGRALGVAVGATALASLLTILAVGIAFAETAPARPQQTDLAAVELPEPASGEADRTPAPAVLPAEGDPVFPDPAAEGDDEPPVGPAAAPAGEQGRDPADASAPPAKTPPPVAEPPPQHPTVAEIRLKLQDPALRKGAAADDLAALEAFYGEHAGPPLWITTVGFNSKAQALLAEIQGAAEWGLPAEAFDLPPAADLPSTTEAQAVHEIKLAFAVLKYARFARGGRVSPSRISNLFDQKSNLLDPKEVLREVAARPSPGAYLASLHPKHDQFERLRQELGKAVAAAKARGRHPSADGLVQRIVVNMERWRWMPLELGAYHVWNNVPAFTTRVMKHGKSISIGKAIVGQVKYATPIFSADMRSIVFNPEWVVPETIKTEDLQPRLRQMVRGVPDVSVLRENRLSVSYQGKPVNATTIDWNRANIHAYTFTQAPGPSNVLGTLKFNFPNRHAVYMHDTVQPALFKETVRIFSHGCIRVHEPERLAALLLAEDKGWLPEQVKSMLVRGRNSAVPLSRPVPVHLTYFTLAYDGVGKLQTYADIYGLDGKMAQALFGKSELLAVEAAPKQTERPQRRRAANRGMGGPYLPGLFGN
jgi:L,D-transpeptidase YcbB